MSTFIGIITGIGLLLFAIVEQGGWHIFFNVHALMIAGGGTIAATFISFPLPRVMRTFGILFNVFRQEVEDPIPTIGRIISVAEKARRQSMVDLEKELPSIGNRFLREGLEMVIDGHPPAIIREVMETELEFMAERHQDGAQIFRTAARYAPAFGLIGTLIGLIAMLRGVAGGAQNTAAIGGGMAVALVATFYGALLSNLVFYPVAEKLQSRTNAEILLGRVVLEGILLIQQGINPRIIQQKLNAHLPPELRRGFYRKSHGITSSSAN